MEAVSVMITAVLRTSRPESAELATSNGLMSDLQAHIYVCKCFKATVDQVASLRAVNAHLDARDES